ncbi:Copper transport protein CTR4 [Vanrija pseudolonga]|uniref:Copper transport protein n=1 Tax=Vanrija pseudolonga TaxID=143232 RepID=A0AAF1BFV0_9TREE|nr:Copper transport protein CTR4 [Vanrija pseudolonga]
MNYLAQAARHAGHDDMAGMNMTATATASAAMSSATAAMSHGDHGGMGGNACKISMLWNWNTVDACFLSSTWHVTSKAMFGGSVVGVFFLCMAIEAVRAAARAYDRKIVASRVAAAVEKGNGGPVGLVQPTLLQQLVRALAYGVQFTGAFLVMLLGMYYNGFILFAIFLGHTVGYFVFGRDTVAAGSEHTSSGCAC